ncbi:ABC transporter ATP-binding protein [Spongiactinospora sp. TRM90649]|uniref:ABC transporter ATP-binding protein n=1 Tax=Spongiactinospora sp. TRM90649 TaxID=3031114 RepID=UPI0023F88584|nr:ABC transporter ATP-binding protein [Spongiactinospora sp. TRM90649]MDF5753224.1 ABC transporter ATP-binding protein [Spongiactinospora sp. TRM90649]
MRGWLGPLLVARWRALALGGAAVLVRTAAGLSLPYLVKLGIDDGVVRADRDALTWVFVACVVVVAVQWAAARAEVLVLAKAAQSVLHTVRSRLFAHLQRLSLDFHERERVGGVVARITGDVAAMQPLAAEALVGLVTGAVTAVGVTVVLFVLDWRLALAVMLVAPPLAVLVTWFRRGSAVAWRRVRESSGSAAAEARELVAAVPVLQAFRREEAAAGRLATAYGRERDASRRPVVQAALFFPAVEFGGAAATAVALAVGGHQVIGGALEIGTLAAFLLYLRLLFDPVFQLSELFDSVQAGTAGAARVGQVLARRPAVAEPADPVPPPRAAGELRMRDVRFTYPGDGDPPEALRGVDLCVPAGSTLALVGATGAGKSTIAKLLTRAYDPAHGTVTLDGLDLRAVGLAGLRRAIAYVPQEPFMFGGTILENLLLGRPGADRDEAADAVAAVGADALVRRLDGGLDAPAGDHLAAGERQLLAFARLWIRPPGVLVLDEATGHLDEESERRAQEALRRLRRGRTVVVIAHRLTTVLEADQVAVISNGRVVESGPPATLLTHGGPFATLYAQWRKSGTST